METFHCTSLVVGKTRARSLPSMAVECEFDRRAKFTVLHSNVQFALFPQAAQRHEPRAARYSCSSISITAALWERKEELLWKTYPKSLISIESNHIGAPIAIRNGTKAIPMDTYGAAPVESSSSCSSVPIEWQFESNMLLSMIWLKWNDFEIGRSDCLSLFFALHFVSVLILLLVCRYEMIQQKCLASQHHFGLPIGSGQAITSTDERNQKSNFAVIRYGIQKKKIAKVKYNYRVRYFCHVLKITTKW